MYFKDCKTQEELKKEYHKLCKQLHPDNGGNIEEFKTMKAEFETAWANVGNVFRTAAGETYTKQTEETAEMFENIIENIIHWTDCNIEICGTWLWITGNTYNHRDDLKKMRFGWSKKKSAWYYHKERYHKKGRRELEMDDIRAMFGSSPIKPNPQPELT